VVVAAVVAEVMFAAAAVGGVKLDTAVLATALEW
jgi:hypothetical protein